MQLNKSVDICGTAIEMFGEDRKSKIISYPTENSVIKYQMLFFCCFAHPTIMMTCKFCESLTYKAGPMEDYRLWLSYLDDASIKFANIGIVLLKLRKHKNNVSAKNYIAEEVGFKT